MIGDELKPAAAAERSVNVDAVVAIPDLPGEITAIGAAEKASYLVVGPPDGSMAKKMQVKTLTDLVDAVGTALGAHVGDNVRHVTDAERSTWNNPTLAGLVDTAITAPQSGQIVKWNGTVWRNADQILPAIASFSAASYAQFKEVHAQAAQLVADGEFAEIIQTGNWVVDDASEFDMRGIALRRASGRINVSANPLRLNQPVSVDGLLMDGGVTAASADNVTALVMRFYTATTVPITNTQFFACVAPTGAAHTVPVVQLVNAGGTPQAQFDMCSASTATGSTTDGELLVDVQSATGSASAYVAMLRCASKAGSSTGKARLTGTPIQSIVLDGGSWELANELEPGVFAPQPAPQMRVFDGTQTGFVPMPPGSADGMFLGADGVWRIPDTSGIADGLAAHIDDEAVHIQDGERSTWNSVKVRGVSYDGATAVLRIDFTDDTFEEINMPKENFLADAHFDYTTNLLTLTLVNGAEVVVDLAELANVYRAGAGLSLDTDTGTFSIAPAGVTLAMLAAEVPASWADADHGHDIDDVAGLQSALDGKAAAGHTHGIDDVAGLPGVLDALNGTIEDLRLVDLADVAIATEGAGAIAPGQVVGWDGTAFVAVDQTGGGGGGGGGPVPFHDHSDPDGSTSTKIGRGALLASTGSHVTAVGADAGADIETGDFITVLGSGAAKNSNGASNGTMLGYLAGNRSTGINNTYVGATAGMSNTTGRNNTSVGAGSAAGATTANDITAVGANAAANTTATITAVGVNASLNNTSGYSNTAVGVNASFSNTSGYSNTAVGWESQRNNRTGMDNSTLGHRAGRAIQGMRNSALGSNALNATPTCSQCVGIGTHAGAFTGAGAVPTSLSQSTFVGDATGPSAVTSTNETTLGFNAIGRGNNTITLGDNSVTGLYCRVGISTTSDRRLKEYCVPAELSKCLETVMALPVSRYKYLADFQGKVKDIHVTGFDADDFGKIFKNAVNIVAEYSVPVLDENGEPVWETRTIKEQSISIDPITREESLVDNTYEVRMPKNLTVKDVKTIDTTQCLPTLWGAFQQLYKQHEELLKRVEALEKKLKGSPWL